MCGLKIVAGGLWSAWPLARHGVLRKGTRFCPQVVHNCEIIAHNYLRFATFFGIKLVSRTAGKGLRSAAAGQIHYGTCYKDTTNGKFCKFSLALLHL
jgi:hypothetical protein